MKIDQFVILLDRKDGVFIAGDKVEGRVLLKTNKPISVRAIYMSFQGKAKAKWEVYKQDTNKTYRGYETYIDETKSLYSTGGHFVEFAPDSYMYRFSITLSRSIPSSFEGRKGYIRYSCTARIDRQYKEEEEVETTFTVIHPLDLNTIPSAREPAIVQKETMVESCCCDAGIVFLQLKIEKSGFVPGELIDVTMDCHNNTASEIGQLMLQLLQNVTYLGSSDCLFSSHQPKYHTKTTPFDLYLGTEGMERYKYVSVKQSIMLPAMPPSKLEGCGIINIEYELSLSVTTGLEGACCTMFIMIGTVPLRMPVTRGPIIRRTQTQAQSPVNQSAVANPSDVNPVIKAVDLPPSYEECVFGRIARKNDGKSDGMSPIHNIDRGWTPSYPMLNNDASSNQSQPVMNQPSSSNT